VLHQNINGLITKCDIFAVCLDDLQEKGMRIDVMCLTEHNMKTEDIAYLNFPNFKIAACFARNNRNGGSCIMVRHGLDFSVIDNFSQYCMPNVLETCAIELVEHKITIVSMYRVPKSENSAYYYNVFYSKLDDILHGLTRNNKNKIIICGDFNIDVLANSKYSLEFQDIILSHNFKLSIKEPTRPSSGTCLDNIIHNIRGTKAKVHEFAISDHKAQLMTCPTENKTFLVDYWLSTRRDLSKECMTKFRNCIKQLSFIEIINITNGDEAFTAFYDSFKLFYDLCFPLVRKKIYTKNKPKWISAGIKKCSKRKRLLLWKYRLSKNVNDRLTFNEYSSRYNRIIKLTQKSQNDNYIMKSRNKSKATWSIINYGKQKVTRETVSQLCINNECITCPRLIAQAFNNYYIDLQKPHNLSSNCPNKGININNSCKSLFMSPTDPDEVYSIIKTLKNTNSTGFDDISTKAIKYVAQFISNILCYVINLCLEQGVFPSKLKATVVKPIHKKGNKTDIQNYRPVALIPIFAKIIEKIIHKRIYNFFESKDLFNAVQKGFRKGESTESAVYEFLEIVYNRMDKRLPVHALYLDMTKAFDYVNHSILLRKLESYGVRGMPLVLLKSYLSGRMQVTYITKILSGTRLEKTFVSSPRTVTQGVPQGSVLGPLLFLVYINDLPMTIHNSMILFADDCTVICNSEDEIKSSIMSIIEWLTTNNLQINLKKTNVMNFGQRMVQQVNRIFYEGNEVTETKQVKFLGLYIDSDMKWQTHIDFVRKKILQFSYALRMLKKIVNQRAVIVAYHGFVASRLRYGIIFWGNAINIDRLFIAQKCCIRAICNLGRMDSCRPSFKSLKLMTLPSLYIYEVALYIKRNPHLFPKYTSLRRCDCLVARPNVKTALFGNGVFGMASKIYNRLPADIRKCDNFLTFKRRLFDYLTEKTFYSIKEYLGN
jgi:exonuclease III